MTYITKKNADGIYEKVKAPEPEAVPVRTDVSIDFLLNQGLLTIQRAMKYLTEKAVRGVLEREDIQNLKDLMGLLGDLKDKEDEILENLSDEELEKYGKD